MDGVPLMAPVEVLKERPLGSEGLISQLVTSPPLTLGVLVVIAESFVRVMLDGEYEREPGASALMVMLMLPEEDPPELFAQTV